MSGRLFCIILDSGFARPLPKVRTLPQARKAVALYQDMVATWQGDIVRPRRAIGLAVVYPK